MHPRTTIKRNTEEKGIDLNKKAGFKPALILSKSKFRLNQNSASTTKPNLSLPSAKFIFETDS